MAETKYIVDIEYVTHGDPGGGLGKLNEQADAFAAAQKSLGKEILGLGRNAADAYTGAVEAAGRLVATGAGAALGAGLAGAVYGVTTLNAGLEATQYSLAAIDEANGWVKTFSDGLSHASAMMHVMRKDAAAGLGTYEDLANIFKTMATPAGQAGMSEAATEAMASKFMNFGKVQGVSGDVTARQAANLLAGRAGAHNTIGSRLGLMGESAKTFNASGAEQRAATLEKLLAQKLRPDALAAFTNTYAAQSTTMISSLKEFGGKSTEAVFDRVVTTLREANDWISANKGEVDHWAYAISSKLTWAWDTGKALILEWGPLVATFADNAAARLGTIWDDWKPTIVSIGDALKQALKDPGTLDKIILALKLYAGLKVGGALVDTFGGVAGAGMKAASSGVGAMGGMGPTIAAFVSAGPAVLATTVALAGLALAADQAYKLYEESNERQQQAINEAESLAKNLSNLVGGTGEVDKASVAYLETVASLARNSGEASVALLDFAVDTRNASLGLKALLNAQNQKDQADVVATHGYQWNSNAGAVAAFLKGDDAKKKQGPGGGAGHQTMIVYQTISSNQSPGQIAQSVVKALASAKGTKKFTLFGTNISARGTI